MQFLQLLFRLENKTVSLIYLIHFFTGRLIGRLISLCFRLHLFYFFLAETTAGFDTDLLFFSSAFIFRCYVKDTISINIKYYFNLGNSSWSWWNTIQVEYSQALIVF